MTIKILFLDDEKLILKALERALRNEGFELYFSSEPLDAVKLVGAHNIDIIVSDHVMPEMTGVEVLSLVRRLHGRCMRMMMSGEADRDATIRAINEGHVHKFLEKPWDPAMLKAVLHDAARTITVQRSAEPAPIGAPARKTRAHPTIVRDATGHIALDVTAA